MRLFWRSAATTPRPMPAGTITQNARTPSVAVYGHALTSRALTVRPWYWYDSPKSKCVTFQR